MNYLMEGDIIDLKNGMEVYTELESRFIYSNTPLSQVLAKTEVIVGQTIKIPGSRSIHQAAENIVKNIEEVYSSELGLKIPFSQIEDFVRKSLPSQKFLEQKLNETTKTEPGKFVVIHTETSGGGTGMPLSGPDEYPDGYLVKAKRLNKEDEYDEEGTEISFYQSGCFSAMIRPGEIEVVGHYKQTFV